MSERQSDAEREQAYVEREVAITKAQIERGLLRDHDGRTLLRSEAYARWRWRAVLNGEVASL